MKLINNQRVCNGCEFSSLHYCNKFNEICLSGRYKTTRYQMVCPSCLENDSYNFIIKQCKENIEPCANFRLPGLHNLNAIQSLLCFQKFYPEAFLPNRVITSIYDAFPGALWNGRQPLFEGKIYSREELINLRERLENLNLSLNLTWNNHLISHNELNDNYCNIITQVFHNGKHSITVGSLILFEYLKKKYPNYTYFYSTIPIDNLTLEEQNFNLGFDKYVIPRKFNNNWEQLLSIPEEDRDKIELLCNDFCNPNCNRLYHYNLGNQLILERSNPINPVVDYCSLDYDFLNFNNDNWPITIKSKDIDEYKLNGFLFFKLCSRSDSTEMFLLKILPYFVKPQYLLDVFSWCINNYTSNQIYSNEEEI